jgi:hypothetical protein
MPAPTAAERRAKIRARLREADEPAGTVEETTNTFTEEVPPPAESPIVEKHKIGGGTIQPGLPNAATSRRSGSPPNYKLHVLTALTLAIGIRISRYGTKALTG